MIVFGVLAEVGLKVPEELDASTKAGAPAPVCSGAGSVVGLGFGCCLLLCALVFLPWVPCTLFSLVSVHLDDSASLNPCGGLPYCPGEISGPFHHYQLFSNIMFSHDGYVRPAEELAADGK